MEILAETSDAVQIATLITGCIATLISGVLTYLMARLNAQAKTAATASDNAATAVKEVKETLKIQEKTNKEQREETDEKLEGLAEIGAANHELGQATHNLVNGGLAPLLKSAAEDSEFKAKATGDEGDRARADASKDMYENHMKNQNQLPS
jgi:phosphoglycolate phosphatase-like HAD superfamily hydrolase